jgi:hypothetical protein
MHVADECFPGAQRAELVYRALGKKWEGGRQGEGATEFDVEPHPFLSVSPSFTWATLLEVRPLTGRKHQIRLQLAHAGYPITGDRKYGSTRQFPAGIALHSRRLVIDHPVSKMQMEIEAPLPAAWQNFVKWG